MSRRFASGAFRAARARWRRSRFWRPPTARSKHSSGRALARQRPGVPEVEGPGREKSRFRRGATHAIPLQQTVRSEAKHRDQETRCPPGRHLTEANVERGVSSEEVDWAEAAQPNSSLLTPRSFLNDSLWRVRDDSIDALRPQTIRFARLVDGPDVHGCAELPGATHDQTHRHGDAVILVWRADRAVRDASRRHADGRARDERHDVAARRSAGEWRLEERVE